MAWSHARAQAQRCAGTTPTTARAARTRAGRNRRAGTRHRHGGHRRGCRVRRRTGRRAGGECAALRSAGPATVVSDVGSTKLALDEARRDRRFVGGHPLAGAETAGVGGASEDLFEGATWYLTPTDDTDEALYERLRDLIDRFGARPQVVDADAHDHLMACISHVPHVLANVLAAQATTRSSARALRRPRAPACATQIRVAGANTAIWTDIYLTNRDALIEAIDEAERRLDDVRAKLLRGDSAALAAWNERARADREELLG